VVAEAEATDWRGSAEARRAAFIALVEAHHADLVRLAFGICGVDLAADAAQSAWQAAWRQADQLRDMSAVRSWLLSITANQARRLMRRRRLRQALELRARGAPRLDDPDMDLDLAAALHRLSARDRQLVTLRYALGLTSEEIGAQVGLSRLRACGYAWPGFSPACVRSSAMADRHDPDFERRLAARLRRHLDRALRPVHARALVDELAEVPSRRGPSRRSVAVLELTTVVLASVLTVSTLRLFSPGASLAPLPTSTTPPNVLSPPPIDQAGTFADGGLWARRGTDLYVSVDGGATWSHTSIADTNAIFVLDADHAWTVVVAGGSAAVDPSQALRFVCSARRTAGGPGRPYRSPAGTPVCSLS
jgi:RNA polymerase sigma factor (sigma-70 family)